MAKNVKDVVDMDVRTAVIGHLQRGGAPTANDRFLASKLSYNAVKALIDGQSGIAIGLVDKKIVSTPLMEAISKKKEPEEGIIQMAEILSL